MDWMQSHAMLPTPYLMQDRIRVFVAFCDSLNVGRVGYVDVRLDDPTSVLGFSQAPLLDIGEPGMFDDNGVNPVTVIERNGDLWLYYVGWQIGRKVRYTLFTGLAISTDDGHSFQRKSTTPVLDRCPGEELVRTAACVRPDGDGWQAWYAGGGEFVWDQDRERPTYALRHARSSDGINWTDASVVFEVDRDQGILGYGRPFVAGPDEAGIWHLFYSLRSEEVGYTIRCVVSPNGRDWAPRDNLNLGPSGTGFDSEATCFPAVVDTPTGRYMFYNGNDYGRSGFGVAKLEVMK